MKTSRTMLKTIKGTALLAVLAAASSCVDADVSDAPPEALTTECAEGTELVFVLTDVVPLKEWPS